MPSTSRYEFGNCLDTLRTAEASTGVCYLRSYDSLSDGVGRVLELQRGDRDGGEQRDRPRLDVAAAIGHASDDGLQHLQVGDGGLSVGGHEISLHGSEHLRDLAGSGLHRRPPKAQDNARAQAQERSVGDERPAIEDNASRCGQGMLHQILRSRPMTWAGLSGYVTLTATRRIGSAQAAYAASSGMGAAKTHWTSSPNPPTWTRKHERGRATS